MSTPLPVPNTKWPADPVEIPELDQTPGDIVQEQEAEDERIPPIQVVTAEPVRSIALPTKRSTFYTVSGVTTSMGVQLVGRDQRRSKVTILGLTQGIKLGGTQAGAVNGASWPSVVPYVDTSMGEIWAVSATSTTDITVIAEYWAD